MVLHDSDVLRRRLTHLFPTLNIEKVVPTPSSQRVVYFCSFDTSSDDTDSDEHDRFKSWSGWGRIVLKVSQNIHPKNVARLEKEIEILNSLNSEYFPALHYYDVFSEDPVTEEMFTHSLFITIEERIEGLSLDGCRENYKNENEVSILLYELTEGLKILWKHKQRIVHRDLKPDNIIIQDNGKPVIIDLGIIREEGSAGLTATNFFSGPCSPAYASPEQARNDKRNISFRSDFFALGIIGYELITGENPFISDESDFVEDVLERVIRHDPDTLYSRQVSSERFSEFISKLMMKEPYQRFRTVDSLQDELKEIIGGS